MVYVALLVLSLLFAGTLQFQFKHHNNDELLQVLQDVNTRCPNITRLYTLSETSVLGIPLYVIEFSTKPGHHEIKETSFCEIPNCGEYAASTCFRCKFLLCLHHFFANDVTCITHVKNIVPQDRFQVDGAPKEVLSLNRRPRINNKTIAKTNKQRGQEYISCSSKKIIPKRGIRAACSGDFCKKIGKSCRQFTPLNRKEIFDTFYNFENIQLKREYVARYTHTIDVNQRTTGSSSSRRNKTILYHLPLNGKSVKVCKTFFLNTLDVSEKFVRTALAKLTGSGAIETDRRGGRSNQLSVKDSRIREEIRQHILRFPKAESHYCRQSSKREYLNGNLSVSQMHTLYKKEELDTNNEVASYNVYRSEFLKMNLSFNNPKKDQCPLCFHYINGNAELKHSLKAKLDKHNLDKQCVREIKSHCKTLATENPTSHVSAVFDLQQVIYLPRTKDARIFYKNRLSNYNFTVYDLATKNCECFLWHEAVSKRGASEISTCVYLFLKDQDLRKIQNIHLFADGCPGQNKNTIMAVMLLYFINISKEVSDISLKFFEPYHGQNEGDSAHSAINYCLNKAGDIFTPTQLPALIRLARRNKPYKVREMQFDKFLDFKAMSRSTKILNIRKCDTCNLKINWNEIKEIKVLKESAQTIFFKIEHTEQNYHSLSLKVKMSCLHPEKLNAAPNKVNQSTFTDLLSMCSGELPVITATEHQLFYRLLPHN